jgi:carbon monoxide dehydrogenase subunit G
MHEIRMQQRFDAPPERVFAAVTNHEGLSEWIDGVRVTLEESGVPAPNGLGAVRRVSARGLTIREKVVGWEAPRAMDYRVIGGAPFRDHLGELRLQPADAGTLLDYRIRFRVPWYFGGRVLGSLIARQLRGEIEKGLGRLASRIR